MKKLEFTGVYDVVQRNFDAIEQAVPVLERLLGGRSLEVGTGSVTWGAAGQNSDATVVNHGMTGTPVWIGAHFHDTGSVDWSPVANVYSVGASQFTIVAHNDISIPISTSISFWWLGIA